MITFDCFACKRRTNYEDNHFTKDLDGNTICDICAPHKYIYRLKTPELGNRIIHFPELSNDD